MQEGEDHVVKMLQVEVPKKRDTLLEFMHSIQTATSMRIVGTLAELQASDSQPL